MSTTCSRKDGRTFEKMEEINVLTITFPTSRIDAAIPEKENPKEAEGQREKRSSESRDTLEEVGL